MLPEQKLDALLARHDAVEANLAREVAPDTYVKLSREFAELAPIVETVKRYRSLVGEIEGLNALIADAGTDVEMRAMASAEKPAADAALGLAVATMAELIDAWQWGSQTDAQAFAAGLAARLDTVVPSPGRPFVTTFRTKVQAGVNADRAGASDALTAAIAVFDAAVPIQRRQRLALGSAAAQLAYNAANARSVDTSRNLLTVLAGSDVLDAAIPGWKAARTDGEPIGAGDWLAQHAYAVRFVELIQKANRS